MDKFKEAKQELLKTTAIVDDFSQNNIEDLWWSARNELDRMQQEPHEHQRDKTKAEYEEEMKKLCDFIEKWREDAGMEKLN